MTIRHKPDVSEDELYMFRCLISLAYADHVFEQPEKDFVQTLIDGNTLSEDQRLVLEDDMVNPKAIEDLYPHIKEPVNRAQVVHFARVMAYKDGELEASESTIMDKLHASAMKNIDMAQIRFDVQKAVQKQMDMHDDKIEGIKIPSWFEKFEKILNRFGLEL